MQVRHNNPCLLTLICSCAYLPA